MKFDLSGAILSKQLKGCLILGVFEESGFTQTGLAIDRLTQGALQAFLKKGIFQAKLGQTLPLFHVADSQFEQILLVGCGKKRALTASAFRKIIVAALKSLISTKTTHATCYFGEIEVEHFPLTWKIRQIVEVSRDATYHFDLFKTKKEAGFVLKQMTIHVPDTKDQKAYSLALKQGNAIADGMSLAKNLANLPSNICTPSFLAEQAKELAKKYRALSLKVLDEKEMQKLKMGALLAVSQGSAEAAKLICLEYKGSRKKSAPVVLIGKGVTFDTGGNSIKAADSMVGMKYDMCGAAAVLGTLLAVSELALPINVVGIIPSVENMPGGTAYKPEDILTSMSGQTIEVISTDAEGRLILADALTYCERYKPDVVIDIATLTGAVVIALGFHTTGLVANNQPLADDLLKAGNESNDRAWQLPMFEEYQEQIKSPFADMANTGGRSAGTITAACFLSRFAKKFDWAHLDVAGTAAMMMGTQERMATGRPVPLLVQYLLNRTADA